LMRKSGLTEPHTKDSTAQAWSVTELGLSFLSAFQAFADRLLR
jgi:hypothetical protein